MQFRDGLDEEAVERYGEVRESLPAMKLVEVDGNLILADGHHRLEAHERAGTDELIADVEQGTEREVRIIAAIANIGHGLPLKKHERDRAIVWMAEQKFPHRDIAAKFGLNPTRVSQIATAGGVRMRSAEGQQKAVATRRRREQESKAAGAAEGKEGVPTPSTAPAPAPEPVTTELPAPNASAIGSIATAVASTELVQDTQPVRPIPLPDTGAKELTVGYAEPLPAAAAPESPVAQRLHYEEDQELMLGLQVRHWRALIVCAEHSGQYDSDNLLRQAVKQVKEKCARLGIQF